MRFAALILLAFPALTASAQDAVDGARAEISPAEATRRAIAAMELATGGEMDAAVHTMQVVGRFQSRGEVRDGALLRQAEGRYVGIYANGKFRVDFESPGNRSRYVEVSPVDTPSVERDDRVDQRFTVLSDGRHHQLFSHSDGSWEREYETFDGPCHCAGFPFRHPLFLAVELSSSIELLQRDDLIVEAGDYGFVASVTEDGVTTSATINSSAGFRVCQVGERDQSSFQDALTCTWAEENGFSYAQRLKRRCEVVTSSGKDVHTAMCTILSLQTNVEIEDSLFLKTALGVPLEPTTRPPLHEGAEP